MFDKNIKFELSDAEYNDILEWYNNHVCKVPIKSGLRSVGPIGDDISITFIPTTLGNFVTIKCACGAEFHISPL